MKKLMRMCSPNKTIKTSTCLEDTFNIGLDIGTRLNKGITIGLSGELGVGKTIFAKGLGEGLGVKELITSPTFLGINEYYSGRLPFIHMDFYQKVVDIKKINFYIDKNAVILIEWTENFNSMFNEKLKTNTIVYIKYLRDKEGSIIDNERQIVIESDNT